MNGFISDVSWFKKSIELLATRYKFIRHKWIYFCLAMNNVEENKAFQITSIYSRINKTHWNCCLLSLTKQLKCFEGRRKKKIENDNTKQRLNRKEMSTWEAILSTNDIASHCFFFRSLIICIYNVAFNCVAQFLNGGFFRVASLHMYLLYFQMKIKQNKKQLIRQLWNHANQLIMYNKGSKIYWQIYNSEEFISLLYRVNRRVRKQWKRSETDQNHARMFAICGMNSCLADFCDETHEIDTANQTTNPIHSNEEQKNRQHIFIASSSWVWCFIFWVCQPRWTQYYGSFCFTIL